MTPADRSVLVKRVAASLGFERCGIAPAAPIAHADYLREWLAAGRAGSMGYLHRRIESRLDPRALMPAARSVIVVAHVYNQQPPPPPPDSAPRGRIAMYAWGDDYHLVIREKLDALIAQLRREIPEPFDARPCVDTSAIIERELAAAAGLGWIGKNTLVLHQHLGSYFFLGVILTTLDLAPDAPATDHCGTCTRCLDACPTDAFPAPYQMNATRCISYLTIEHRAEIPAEFHRPMDNWLFGCDICQQVCPYNKDAPLTKEPRYAARSPAPTPTLSEILAWTPADHAKQTQGKATDRATLNMWHRNAAIVAANPRS